MDVVVNTTLPRSEVIERVRRLPGQLNGKLKADPAVSEGFRLRIAIKMLSLIEEAFVDKARGGQDFAGESWPKLSKKYLAYGRRFGPTEQRDLKKAANLGRENRLPGKNKGLLTAAQLKRWRQLFARVKAWLEVRGVDSAEASGKAAAYAWNTLKAEGAKTKLEVFGNRDVEILRDTGVLFNSLSPGVEDKPSGAPNQRLDLSVGEIRIVCTVPYAAAHHFGRGVPQRRLWPDPEKWPKHIWDEVLATAARGVARAIALTLTV